MKISTATLLEELTGRTEKHLQYAELFTKT
jgi:hypothetical protein